MRQRQTASVGEANHASASCTRRRGGEDGSLPVNTLRRASPGLCERAMVRGFRSRAGGVESGSGGSREVSDLEQVVDDGRPDTLVQTESVTL